MSRQSSFFLTLGAALLVTLFHAGRPLIVTWGSGDGKPDCCCNDGERASCSDITSQNSCCPGRSTFDDGACSIVSSSCTPITDIGQNALFNAPFLISSSGIALFGLNSNGIASLINDGSIFIFPSAIFHPPESPNLFRSSF